MRVNHPALVDWNPKSSLLHAIKEVHKVFNENPPKLAKKEQKAAEEQKSATLIQKPDLDEIQKQVKRLDENQMKTLLEDDEFFNDYFIELPGVDSLSKNFASIMQGLHSQAEENLKAKEQLDQEIENHDVLYSEYEELAKEHEKLKSTKDKIMGKLSHSHLMAAVKEKKHEHE